MRFLEWIAGKLFQIRGIGLDRPTVRAMVKKELVIAGPATVEGVLLSIISSVDTMMVGTLGSAAIAAVGLTAQPRMILMILAQALCVGTTSLIARRKGAEDQQSAQSCLQQSMALVTLLGGMMMLGGYFLAEPFMYLAGANQETIGMATEYFRIISLAMVFNCWSLCICAAFRAIGQTRITMVTNITANLINIVLNYLLIGGNFGMPALGVTGAAIATATGTVVSSGIALFFAARPRGYLCYRPFARLQFDRLTMRGLFRVGGSSMAESAFLRIGFLVLSKLVAGIGTAAFAAYQIVSQITSLSFTLGDGIASAGASLVGQSLGAKKKDIAHAYIRISSRLALLASIVMMAVIVLLRKQFAMMFTQEPDIIASVSLCFIVVFFGIIPQNARVVLAGCLRGAGDVKFVAVCSLVSVAVLRPLLTYLFCYPLESAFPALSLAVMGPWLAFDIDAYVRNVLLDRHVKKGAWASIQL